MHRPISLLSNSSSSSSFICPETQIQYGAKIKTWTLNKTHQAYDKLLWWPLRKKHTNTQNIQNITRDADPALSFVGMRPNPPCQVLCCVMPYFRTV